MARLTISDLEIERNEDPFEYELSDGTVVTLADPKSIPAKKLAVLEQLSPAEQLAAVGANELLERDEVDGYVLESLMQLYARHFGLGSLGNVSALPRSSSATARRSKQTSQRRG